MFGSWQERHLLDGEHMRVVLTSLRLLKTVNLFSKILHFLFASCRVAQKNFLFWLWTSFEAFSRRFLVCLLKLCKNDAKIRSKSIKNLHKLKPAKKVRQESFAWIYINYSAKFCKSRETGLRAKFVYANVEVRILTKAIAFILISRAEPMRCNEPCLQHLLKRLSTHTLGSAPDSRSHMEV